MNNKLIQEALDSFEWDKIFTIYKLLEHGVGEDGSVLIPGLKRIPYDKIKKEDIIKELELVINYVIDQDHSELNYGDWTVFWISSEWKLGTIEDENGVELPANSIKLESQIEIHFVPSRIWVVDKEIKSEEKVSLPMSLEAKLADALSKEDYETAARINMQIEKIRNSSEKNNEKLY